MLPKEGFVSQNCSVAFALEVRHSEQTHCGGDLWWVWMRAGYPHQGIEKRGIFSLAFETPDGSASQKTAVLEEPLIFALTTPL